MKPLPLLVIKFFNHKRDCGVSQRANILRDIDKVFLFFLNTNFASKREQCQTCLSIAEREQSQDRDSGIN